MKNKRDYKYGSVEFDLAELQDKLGKHIDSIQALRMESGTIMSVEIIKSSFLLNIQDYYRPIGGYGSRNFDRTNEGHVSNAIRNAKNRADEVVKQAEAVHEKNLPAIENNTKLRAKIKGYMEACGIRAKYTVYDYPTSRHRRKKSMDRIAGYVQDLDRCVPINDGYDEIIRRCKEFVRRVDEKEREWKAIATKAKKEQEAKDRELREVAMAVQIAGKHGKKHGDFATNKHLISFANSVEREKFLKEQYPDGTELSIKCCTECNSWTVGEHRCSCGNRRMYLETEGNFLDGFTAYPMAD